jgi:hypothetical protein
MQLMAENPVARERWIQRWGRPAGETVRWWQWGPKARRWRRSAWLRLPEKKKEQASQWGQGNGNNTVMQPTRGPAARAFVLPLTFAGRVRTSNPEGWDEYIELTLRQVEHTVSVAGTEPASPISEENLSPRHFRSRLSSTCY